MRLNKIYWILLSFLLLIPLVYAIMEIEITNENLVMPGNIQSVKLTIIKPTFSNPVDLKINLTLNGSAYFLDGKNNFQIDINEINWTKGLIKKYMVEIPINVIKDGNSINKVTIYADLEYYNTLFGYKKTKPTIESYKKYFSIIWLYQDEEVYNSLTEVQSQLDAIKLEYDGLQKEYKDLSDRNNELKDENNNLKEENIILKRKQFLFNFYKYSTILLFIMLIYLVIEQMLIKRKKKS